MPPPPPKKNCNGTIDIAEEVRIITLLKALEKELNLNCFRHRLSASQETDFFPHYKDQP